MDDNPFLSISIPLQSEKENQEGEDVLTFTVTLLVRDAAASGPAGSF